MKQPPAWVTPVFLGALFVIQVVMFFKLENVERKQNLILEAVAPMADMTSTITCTDEGGNQFTVEIRTPALINESAADTMKRHKEDRAKAQEECNN